MGAIADIEWREEKLTPQERAAARDNYVREFDRQFRQWSDIAHCCLDVKRDRDWELLGFHSFDAWLKDAAPASRAYIYAAIGFYDTLIPDIPEAELQQIPLGSAGVLAKMSPNARQDPEIRKAAKSKPSEFLKRVQEIRPEQHMESKIRQVLVFSASQWSVVEATFQKYQVMLDPDATLASFIEFLCSEIAEWTFNANADADTSNPSTTSKSRMSV